MERSAIDLLDEPFALTQQKLLPVGEFIASARDRDLSVTEVGLQHLHRAGILVPLFRISYDARSVMRQARKDRQTLDERTLNRVLHTVSQTRDALIEERRVGDLHDPADEPFQTWRTTGRWGSTSYRRSQFLYSPYQLLVARPIENQIGPDAVRLLRWRRSAPALAAAVEPQLQEMGRQNRRLALVLESLDTAFRPDVTGTLVGLWPDLADWGSYLRSFDVAAALRRWAWTAESVESAARSLLATGERLDPMSRWHELVRLMHHDRWGEVTGGARLALDYRVAAEILFQALERLATSSDLAPHQSTDRYRLVADRSDLDTVLTRFGLSPYPSVLVVVEGKTEAAFLRRLLNERLRPGWRNFIEIVNGEGTTQNLVVLAVLAAPRVSTHTDEEALLARPVTRFLVVMDPENLYATAANRAKEHRKWVGRLSRALAEAEDVPVSQTEVSGLVEVTAWNDLGESFEFAHSTDEEISDALRSASPEAAEEPRSELIARVAEVRQAQRRYEKQGRNLEAVWARRWKLRPDKHRVIGSLWPVLRKRAMADLDQAGDLAVPLNRVVAQALQMVTQTPRHHSVVLPLRPERQPAPLTLAATTLEDAAQE